MLKTLRLSIVVAHFLTRHRRLIQAATAQLSSILAQDSRSSSDSLFRGRNFDPRAEVGILVASTEHIISKCWNRIAAWLRRLEWLRARREAADRMRGFLGLRRKAPDRSIV